LPDLQHGNGKLKKAKDIASYDVVLTTLQTMAGEWVPDDAVSLLV